MFEPWMLAAMEEAGIMDTKEGQINRVADYSKEVQDLIDGMNQSTKFKHCVDTAMSLVS